MDPGNIINDDRYKILSTLGMGGMGTVYLALDVRLNRKVAIKVIKRELLLDTSILKRTKLEGIILSRLNHPSLAAVYEMNMNTERPYIVQEYITGQDLKSFIDSKQYLTEEKVWRLLKEQASVLSYIHSMNIVHRDIKPANIILDDSGKSILMDFGLALCPEFTRVTREGNFVGTLSYCAPEVLSGKDGGPSSDVYQLGLIAYEAMTGLNLVGKFESINVFVTKLAAREWENAPLHENVSHKLEKIIRATCRFDNTQRPQNGRELALLIDRVLGESSPQAIHSKVSQQTNVPPIPGETEKKSSRRQNTPRKSGHHARVSSGIKSPEIQKVDSKKNMAIAIGFVIILLSAMYLVFSNKNSDLTAKNVSLTENHFMKWKKAFLELNRGFYLFVPARSEKALHWKLWSNSILKNGKSDLTGSFDRVAGGWEALESQLDCPRDTKCTLEVFSESTHYGTWEMTVRETIFQKPLKVSISWEGIFASWSLYGECPVNVTVHSKTDGNLLLSKTTDSQLMNIYSEEIPFRGPLTVSFSFVPDEPEYTFSRSGANELTLACELPREEVKPENTKTEQEMLQSHFSGGIAFSLSRDSMVYAVTKAGNIYGIEKSTPQSATIKWKKTLKSIPDLTRVLTDANGKEPGRKHPNSMTISKDGLTLQSLGTGQFEYTLSLETGEYKNKRPVPFIHLWDQFKDMVHNNTLVRAIPSDEGTYYQWGNREEHLLLFQKKDSDKCHIIKQNSRESYVRFTMSAFETMVCWIIEGPYQKISILEQSPKPGFKQLLRVESSKHIYNKASIAYDESIQTAVLFLDGNLYTLKKNGKNLICSKINLKIPENYTVRNLSSLGNGEFAAVVPGGLTDNLFSVTTAVSVNILSVHIDEKTGKALAEIKSINRNFPAISDNFNSTGVRLLPENRLCFGAGSTFYIINRNSARVVYEKTLPGSLDTLYIEKDMIIAINRYYELIFMTPFGKPVKQ